MSQRVRLQKRAIIEAIDNKHIRRNKKARVRNCTLAFLL